jgi:hypothetical protein
MEIEIKQDKIGNERHVIREKEIMMVRSRDANGDPQNC